MTRRMIFPLLMGIVGAAILIALGVWQVQRLTWKQAILARIEARIADAPVALPVQPDPVRDQYLPVQAMGQMVGPDLAVLVSQQGIGAGYRIIAAMDLPDGRRVLVDRGVVPVARRDDVVTGGSVTVTGNLLWPDEIDGWTPAPDRKAGIWFARDIPAMAAELRAEPLLIVARATVPADPIVTPLPVSATGIPNDHLNYVITWFSLAIVWLGMTGFLLSRIRRRID